MNDSTNTRKLDHVYLAAGQAPVKPGPFDRIRLKHRALPEIDLDEVDPSVSFMGKRLSFPLILTAMTGGDHEMLRSINRRLAKAAEAAGVGLGLGSQRVMFTHAAARSSFEVRAWAPDCLVLANLGAVQLNYGFGIDEARVAIETAGADGLCLHLNPLQEALQPEGNTRFRGLAGRIGALAAELDCPLMVKEVGHGLSFADVSALLDQGVRFFDVAGAGGTSWAPIEDARGGRMGESAFADWGLPTPDALRMLSPLRARAVLMAGGGIRSGVDMVKAMALGAGVCGASAPFLKPAMQSTAGVLTVIERYRREFVTALFCLGLRSVSELTGHEKLLLEEE